jgi:peptidoglycan/LPS O-acetylase OafA/YrhL
VATVTGNPRTAPVPDAVRPPPGNPRFALVDGLRAIAVLLILAFHVAGQQGVTQGKWWGPFALRLDVGVTIFFVISGFLLYRPFVAARLASAPLPGALAYARRRALRILPAYWVALTLLAIYPGLTGVFTGDWWVYYGFLQVYDHSWFGFFEGLSQAWSLCVEVTFYAALPALALLLARLPGRHLRTRVRGQLAILALLSAASLAFRAAVHAIHPEPAGAQTLPGLFLWFALGMALAVVSVAVQEREEAKRSRVVGWVADHPLACWGAAAALFVLAAEYGKSVLAVPANTSGRALVEYVLYALISLLVVLPAVFAGDGGGLPRRVLGHRAVAWLGLVSYGIFLYHLPIVNELSQRGVGDDLPGPEFVALFACAFALSVACAAASYYVVERPLLRLKH